MWLMVVLEQAGEALVSPFAIFAALVAASVEGKAGKTIAAILGSGLIEFWHSQAAPTSDWIYRLSWLHFIGQTLAVIVWALLIGWLAPKLNRFRRQAA